MQYIFILGSLFSLISLINKSKNFPEAVYRPMIFSISLILALKLAISLLMDTIALCKGLSLISMLSLFWFIFLFYNMPDLYYPYPKLEPDNDSV